MKILIADDSRLFRQSLKSRLNDFSGIDKIAEAENFRETVKMLHEEMPDLLILDVKLGDGTGFHVLERLKGKLLKTKIIMCTSFPYPQYRKRALRMGAHYFFDKADDNNLLDLIEGLIGSFNEKAKPIIKEVPK